MRTAQILLIFFIVVVSGIMIWLCVREYKEEYQHDPLLETLRKILIPVHPIFNEIELYKGQKSYTINKKKVYLCLYDENGDYYNMNTLVYVLLHEIAHVLNKEDVGHTKAFNEQFDILLRRAEDQGVFNPNIPVPPAYCTF